jgi:predicted outer membrane repeat protein
MGAVLTVTSTADPGEPGDGEVTLREALAAAEFEQTTDLGETGSGADTLDLSGLSGTILLGSALPTVHTSVNLEGPGAEALTISGGGEIYILAIEGGDVALTGLRIADGVPCDALGGGIKNTGTLTVTACVFENNHAEAGGAIANTGQLNAVDSAFRNNSNTLLGGGVLWNSGEAEFLDCSFTGNYGQRTGTVIRNQGIVTMDRCVLSDNGRVDTKSEATIMNWSGGVLSIRDCTFANNHGSQGGALELLSESTTFATGCTFSENSASFQGGAVFLIGGDADFVNCTFSQNGIYNPSKGGTYREAGAIYQYSGTMSLTNCTLVRNVASAGGGIRGPEKSEGTLYLRNSLVVGNGSVDLSGWIVSEGHNIIGSITGPHQDEIATEMDIFGGFNPSDVYEYELADNGGFTKTHALRPCSIAIDTGSPTFLTDDLFEGSYPYSDQRDATRVQGASVDIGAYEAPENSCVGEGEAEGEFEGEPDIANGLRVTSLKDPGIPDDGQVTLAEAIRAINDGTVTDIGQDGSATDTIDLSLLAGTIYLGESLPPMSSDMRLVGPGAGALTISGAFYLGAYLLQVEFDATAEISGLTIADANIVANVDGAILNFGNLTVSDCDFRDNDYYGNATMDVGGGAIRHSGETLVVEHCRFIGNESRQGGAIFASGRAELEIRDCYFEGNVAGGGGAVLMRERVVSLIERCTFRGNEAGGVGGAIMAEGDYIIRDCLFEENESYNGGAVFTRATGEPEPAEGFPRLNRCTFVGNVGYAGGGLYAYRNLWVANCTFSGNTDLHDATEFTPELKGGGAIHLAQGDDLSLRLSNCTIVFNHSENPGGGLAAIWNRVRVENSIIAGNTSDNIIIGVGEPPEDPVLIDAPDVYGPFRGRYSNIVGDATGSTGFGGSDVIGVAAGAVVEEELQDNGGFSPTHYVLPCGPAFDGGRGSLLVPPLPDEDGSLDQRMQPRIQGCEMDVGAVEYDQESCDTGGIDCEKAMRVNEKSLKVEAGDRINILGCAADEYFFWAGKDGVIDPISEDNFEELAELALLDWTRWLDDNGDGLVSAYEFWDERGHSVADLLVFHGLDTDSNGILTISELNRRLETAMYHRADSDGSNSVDMRELLRIIQLYNAGGYRCAFPAGETEDGYRPGTKTTGGLDVRCPEHSVDFVPGGGDGEVSLSELLRLIQLFSFEVFVRCDNSDDGYCAAP